MIFVLKFVDTETGLLELFEDVTRVWFFWETVYSTVSCILVCFIAQWAGWRHGTSPSAGNFL